MKRIFISFAAEDIRLRDFLKGQAKNAASPFEYIDMSVKTPWINQWKTNCRMKIKGCDGMIAIITKHSKNADGQIWEINCAKQEGIPVLAIYGNDNHFGITVPSNCRNIRIVDWTWENISNWLRRI